ncbi:MAG: ribonuclease HII [Brevinemataceae bacterium]
MNTFLSIEQDINIIQEFIPTQINLMMGTDEAGRGPLAGPLVVAGVVFKPNTHILGIYDSKKLTEQKRSLLFHQIKENALAYHIEIIDIKKINELNIYQASKWGMIKCWQHLSSQVPIDVVLTDAMRINSSEIPETPVLSIIKGDQKSFHIAAASILAKVTRDNIMQNLHNEFPEYNWIKNKGYPTKEHRTALEKFGASPHHRTNFRLFKTN